jgi:hypothetical protein
MGKGVPARKRPSDTRSCRPKNESRNRNMGPIQRRPMHNYNSLRIPLSPRGNRPKHSSCTQHYSAPPKRPTHPPSPLSPPNTSFSVGEGWEKWEKTGTGWEVLAGVELAAGNVRGVGLRGAGWSRRMMAGAGTASGSTTEGSKPKPPAANSAATPKRPPPSTSKPSFPLRPRIRRQK